jgi:hypothetical protein
MNAIRLIPATALLALAGALYAQAPDTGRSNTPPGMSRGGGGPGDGAITGGSIAPGERGGTPGNSQGSLTREQALKRCEDLDGVLREQCVRDAESAASGATTIPPSKAPIGGSDIEPRMSPPPQNPR